MGVQTLVKATGNLDRLEDLFEKIVDGVASAALVSRVGIFYRHENETVYRLQAGRCCLDDTDCDGVFRAGPARALVATASALDYPSFA